MNQVYQVDAHWTLCGYTYHRVACFSSLFDALANVFQWCSCPAFVVFKGELIDSCLFYPLSLVARSSEVFDG